MNPWVSAAESVRAITSMFVRIDRQLRERRVEHLDMIGRGVRSRVAGPQLRGERFAGRVQIRHQRMEPEPTLVGRGRTFLLGMGGDERAVEIDHIEPRIRARRPRLPPEPQPAPSRSERAPSSSTASRVRHAVASDATSPKRFG